MKKIFEGRLGNPQLEDSGMGCEPDFFEDNESENGMFVEIKSWDKKSEHREISNFINKRIRVTVETI